MGKLQNSDEQNRKRFNKWRYNNSKVYLDRQKVAIASTILKEKNKVRGMILLNFKTYCKITVIKTV